MNGGNKSSEQLPKVPLDPTKLDTLKCGNCEGIFFKEVTIFKSVPAMKSPTGKKSMLPIPVIICDNCGAPHEELSPTELF